jgi:hypothetical protein
VAIIGQLVAMAAEEAATIKNVRSAWQPRNYLASRK